MVYLGRFLRSIKGIFKPVTPVDNNINILINKGVLVLLINIAALLITVNNIYKRIFI